MSAATSVTDAIDNALDRVGDVDPRYLTVALALQILILVFRSLAWRNVLAAAYPETRVPVFGLGCSYAAGVAMNGFLPARGGELAKVGLARTQVPGSTVPTIAASLSVATIFDAILGTSLMVVLWALGALPALPTPSVGVGPVSLALGALGVFVLGGAGVLLGLRSERARRIACDALQGFSVLRTPRRYLITVVPLQLAAWACRIGVMLAVLGAYGVHASVETGVLLVLLGGLSTAVPVPGGAGAQQLLSTYALQGTLTAAGAISFSLGMQATVTVINTTLGLLAAMILFRTFRPVAALRAARADVPVLPQ
jgi:glycosyltransferase 2 family protein